MKLMTPVLIVLMGLSAVAQQLPPLDPARQAERDARDAREGRGQWQQPPYIVPGGRPPMPPPPPRPMPPRPRPPMPPPPPAFNDYGPGYTVRWQDFGLNRLPKIANQDVVIDVRGQYVNEILLRAVDNNVQVNSVLAYLSNGQVVDVRQATGNIYNRGEVRVQADYRGSLRVERIVINATSSNLIGSRASLSVILGLAY